MSYTTVLGIMHRQRPVGLVEMHNAFGWAWNIWDRLLTYHGHDHLKPFDSEYLAGLSRNIEELPEWQQTPLVLTFDTGIIPFQAYAQAANELEEFEQRQPAKEGYANHVPAVIELLRSGPEVPWLGVWGTSVGDNPFDPWDEENEQPSGGIPVEPGSVYVLERHRPYLNVEIAARHQREP